MLFLLVLAVTFAASYFVVGLCSERRLARVTVGSGGRHTLGGPTDLVTHLRDEPTRRNLREHSTASAAPASDAFELASEHEQVVFCNDPATGLRAIIAIHSTTLGPSLGGTRFYPFASTAAALTDVLNLSRGMTYKAALAGLDLGGGKAVIIGDPTKDKNEALLRAYGRFVQSLGGRYYTACDVGTYSPTWTSSPASAPTSPAGAWRTAGRATRRC